MALLRVCQHSSECQSTRKQWVYHNDAEGPQKNWFHEVFHGSSVRFTDGSSGMSDSLCLWLVNIPSKFLETTGSINMYLNCDFCLLQRFRNQFADENNTTKVSALHITAICNKCHSVQCQVANHIEEVFCSILQYKWHNQLKNERANTVYLFVYWVGK